MMWRWIGFSILFLAEFLPGQGETQLFDGIRYEHRVQAGPQLSIHLLEVDPTKYRITAGLRPSETVPPLAVFLSWRSSGPSHRSRG